MSNLLWETEGRIKSIRTEGGHRRFTVSNLIGNKQDNSVVQSAKCGIGN
ncbi:MULTISPECIES: hypothetical protein [unclassified Okeania]|nr:MULTISPECIES: hypothetical protein [unclassified Okeania]